jgi:ligand-binding sensor domain-containing protein
VKRLVLQNLFKGIPIILFVCLVFSVENSFSQKRIQLQQLSVNEGLSQNTINFIFQDSRGLMWFGTQNGLNRYDGRSFTIFKNVSEDSSSISSSDVYTAFEDKNKNLWFGTRSGLSLLDRNTNTFLNFDYCKSGYTIRPVWCIMGSKHSENLWLGASGGLFEFNVTTKQFNHYKINDSIQNANSVRAMCEDRRGNMWIGNFLGKVMHFNKSTKTFRMVNHGIEQTSLDLDGISSIIEDADGYIWIGREDGMLFRYDYGQHAYKYYSLLKNKFPIRTMREDKDGYLWIGTDKGGVFLLDKMSGTLTPFSDKRENGSDVVLSLCNDAKGDMWLGTYRGGVFLFDKMDTVFNHFAPYPEIKSSNENNSVLSIYQDDDDVWMGTDGGGLVRKNKETVQYYRMNKNKNSIAGNTILCISPGKDKLLYMGTYADGMSVLDRKTGKFTNYSLENGLNDKSIWVIYPDNDHIWIGTSKGGLNLFNTKTKTFRYFTNTLKDNRSISASSIRCIYKDSRNKLWVGTVSGLNVFNEKDSTFLSFYQGGKNDISNANIVCIYEDTRKNLWIGTHGGGLNKYDYRTDTFTAYEESDGLAGNIVNSIVEDSQGNLWLSTNKGISKFTFERKEFKNFDAGSGLSSAEFNLRAYFKNANGRIYFGSVEGVCSFFPHHIRQNTYVPPIIITDFQLFNKAVSIGEDSPLQKSIEETSVITLDYTQTVFSLKFSALNYTHSDKNNFAYKLEPFDKEWNYVGHTNTATYTNLDPGTYEFKVKGSNNDNVWNEKYTSLTIIVTPPYWKTTWFRVLIIALLLSGLYGAYRFKIRAMKRQREILAELVRQRTIEIEEKNKLLLQTEMENSKLLNKQLNDELTAQRKELTNYTLLIIQKNRLLDELKKKLKEAIRHPASSNLRDFKNLLQLVNYSFSPDKEWTEFYVNFNRVHEGFLNTLKSRFPELTNHDLRLCALYKISIPTRDIAEVMGISQNSVKMARYRLRKKLGLAPEEDITEFLKGNINAKETVLIPSEGI